MEKQKRAGRIVSCCMSLALVWIFLLFPAAPYMAMDAPGDQDPRWEYSQADHNWYFFESDRDAPHTGWLDFHGERYWFDGQGRMASGGLRTIDGKQYYFFINGNMARNQFVGMDYYDGDGQKDDSHEVRKIGRESITAEQRDLFSDELYEVPRSWIARFVEEDWEFLCYTTRKYFAAPDTDRGIYYVYHSVDTYYKKVKFIDVESVRQAFGEYVGYSAGLYKRNHVWMERLWQDARVLKDLLELPDYYADDAQFYFGKLFDAYLDEETREEIRELAPESARVLETILHMHDDEETLQWHKQRLLREQEEAERRKERESTWNYGPGAAKKEMGTEAETEAETGTEAEDTESKRE